MNKWKYGNILRESKLRLREGTWNTPTTEGEFLDLKHFFDKPAPAYMWKLLFDTDTGKREREEDNPFKLIHIGDDGLYDDLDNFSDEHDDADARYIVFKAVKDFYKWAKEDGWSEASDWKDVIEYAKKKLKN